MTRLVDAQRDSAIAWASSARSTREQCRRDLRGGRTTLEAVIDSARHDELVGRLTLLWVLESLPGAGKVATRRKLTDLGLDGSLPIGGLDGATAVTLVDEFGSGIALADLEGEGSHG